MSNKIIYLDKNKNIYVPESKTKNDFHTEYGIVYKEEFNKNSITETHNGNKISVFDSHFSDDFSNLKRRAQIITMKDAAVILAETGVTSETIVFDAGAGSGGLACFLGKYAKKVFSFDIREDHLECCEKNKILLKLDNIFFHKVDITDSESVKKVVKSEKADVFVIDMPEPLSSLKTVKEFLKIGGYFVTYAPQITQAKEIVNAIENDDSFSLICAKEILHRPWDLTKRKSKPLNIEIGHTGFLVFCRKIV